MINVRKQELEYIQKRLSNCGEELSKSKIDCIVNEGIWLSRIAKDLMEALKYWNDEYGSVQNSEMTMTCEEL